MYVWRFVVCASAFILSLRSDHILAAVGVALWVRFFIYSRIQCSYRNDSEREGQRETLEQTSSKKKKFQIKKKKIENETTDAATANTQVPNENVCESRAHTHTHDHFESNVTHAQALIHESKRVRIYIRSVVWGIVVTQIQYSRCDTVVRIAHGLFCVCFFFSLSFLLYTWSYSLLVIGNSFFHFFIL